MHDFAGFGFGHSVAPTLLRALRGKPSRPIARARLGIEQRAECQESARRAHVADAAGAHCPAVVRRALADGVIERAQRPGRVVTKAVERAQEPHPQRAIAVADGVDVAEHFFAQLVLGDLERAIMQLDKLRLVVPGPSEAAEQKVLIVGPAGLLAHIADVIEAAPGKKLREVGRPLAGRAVDEGDLHGATRR